MTSRKSIKVVALTAIAMTATALAVALLDNNNFTNLYQKADATINVTTEHSLLLNEDWGYAGEATKVKRSNEDNDFTIAFSNSSKFGSAGSGLAFTTTEDGLYISTSTLLNGISQVYVKGSSSNGKNGINVYGHFYRQTNLVNDSETINGELNSLISFAPTNYVAIEFEGTDSIEYVEIGYSCTEATDPYDYMMSGGQNTDGNGLFQSMTGLKTTLEVGTVVEVQMDVAVTGTFDVDSCAIYWVDQVYTVNGGESDKARTDIKSTIVTGESGWHHVTFTATVRNFPNLRFNTKYATQDTSEFGNAVYLIAITHGSLDSFNYKNVTITPEYYSMIYGGANKTGNGFHQSATGLKTTLAVGTTVVVQMDVLVTGSFNEYSSIYVVDSVWSVDGGERNSTTNIKSIIATGDTDWHHVTFNATVRNFAHLRNNANYNTIIDTSSFGNAVYILTENNSEATFNYKNVQITKEFESMIPGGDNGNNNDKYYQSVTGLMTDLAIGTSVTVTMDVNVTGTFNSYSHVYWIDSVYTTAGGEANAKTNIDSTILGDAGWRSVTFTATVRNFPNLRYNTSYSTIVDTSSFGNAVYLIAMNKSADSFNYKNVVITAA